MRWTTRDVLIAVAVLVGIALFIDRCRAGQTARAVAEADSLRYAFQNARAVHDAERRAAEATIERLRAAENAARVEADTQLARYREMAPRLDSARTPGSLIDSALTTLEAAEASCRLGWSACDSARLVAEDGWRMTQGLLSQAGDLAIFQESVIQKLDRYRPRGIDRTLDFTRLGGCVAAGYGLAEGSDVLLVGGGATCAGLTVLKLLRGR